MVLVRIFFFQAEDGIRDLTVTGVQTCALPIWDDDELSRHRSNGLVLGAGRVDFLVALDVVAFAEELHRGVIRRDRLDRKSTRLNSSHSQISYAVFCLKKKKQK